MDTERELIDGSTLPAQVEDPDLILMSMGEIGIRTERGGPWNQGHPCYIETWDMAYSCSNGSSELDDVPSWYL